jgi:superfamily II DNA or RNA helicase
VVASIDFVKRPEVLPLVLASSWDVVVVDEAHGSSGDSDRRTAVARLCERAPYVLLLTATPHNGDEDAFASLCQFGQHADSLVVFRRSRLEAGRDAGRRAHTLEVVTSQAERGMHAALQALTRAVQRESTRIERHAWLMLALFHKRALSCPYALAASVERRLQLLGSDTLAGHEQLLLPLDDETGDLDGTDTAPMWATPALQDLGKERRLLEQLAAAAREAQGDSGKLHRLHRLLGRLREPAIVFTEYRDTLLHLQTQVAPGASIIHGGMTREQRHAALVAFPTCGLLLATDAAGEGLNLQQHCRTVINLELPWNPMRLEQRIGRVDRIGQRKRVHVFYLVSRGTGETRLLDRLTARVSHAQARVGAPNPMCGRPAWTEEQSARLVVLSDDSTPANTSGLPLQPAVPVTRLRAEAEREADRLGTIRRVLAHSSRDAAGTRASTSASMGNDAVTGGGRLSANAAATRGATASGLIATDPAQTLHVASPRHSAVGPLVARTRLRATRAALGAQTVAVFRTTIHNAAGHIVATRVEAVQCADSSASGTRLPQYEALASQLDSPVRRAWIAEMSGQHEQQSRLRVERARAIATGLVNGHHEYQPGLFDRRVAHEVAERSSERDAARGAADERVLQAEAAARISVAPPELVLLLFTAQRTCRP